MRTMSKSLSVLAAVLAIGVLTACVDLVAREDAKPSPVLLPLNTAAPGFVQCHTPRPEICYELYAPVCAARDNGLRCITAPCPSAEQATYGNDCKACSDPRVMGFVPGGECK